MTARPSRAGKKRRKAREWWIDPSDENVYGTRQEAYFAGNTRRLVRVREVLPRRKP